MTGTRHVFPPALSITLVVLVCSCSGESIDPTVTLMPPQGDTRRVDFTTDEGTWMSVDISPDGQWIVFDLLGHIYRMRAEGGEAVALTQNSGPAINVHPRISPDGQSIAFISDRQGQENLWVMNADGSGPRPVHLDNEVRHREPAWTPDGQNILVTHHARAAFGFIGLATSIWMHQAEGGEGKQIAAGKAARYRWPAITPDGQTVYYFTAFQLQGTPLGATEWIFVQSIDLGTGEKSFLREHPDLEVDPEGNPFALESDVTIERIPELGQAEMAPEVSPDGRWIAFAKQMKGTTQEYRGHQYGPSTALMLRELETGNERMLMNPISIDITRAHRAYASRVLPGYAWAPDGQSIVISEGGKIRRVSVETGDVTTIPFTARVRRTLSEQPRSQVSIDDDTLTAKFLQWPSSSPDGARLAFVGVGKIWVVDLPDGEPRPLAPDLEAGLQLTPAWSPDGSRIAFTTWDDLEHGSVWSIAPDGSNSRILTTNAGQYLYPSWSPDGSSLVALRGPGVGPPEEWSGWQRGGDWTAVRIPAGGGAESDVVTLPHLFQAHFGQDGRVYYHEYVDSATVVRSVTASGKAAREHVRLSALSPYFIDERYEPLLSSDGRWVAYQTARSIFVAPVSPSTDGETPFIETNPNEEVANRVRVGSRGGVYHRWRDATTLEFVTGDRHVVYDAARDTMTMHPIELRVPRHPPTGTIALTNARVITLEDDGVLDNATVLVSGARIECIGECETSGADRVMDLTGKTIVPGFLDVHAHHTAQGSPVVTQHWYSTALDLAYGVTTILDAATISTSAFPLAEMTAAGTILGARTFSVAENAYGWGNRIQIESYEDAQFKVNRRADWGAISLKVYRMLRRDQQQLFVHAARERGITVTSEGGFLQQIVTKAIDGQTGWEHWIPYIPVYRDLSTFLGRANMVYSPTITIAGHNKGMEHYYRPRHDLEADEKYRRFFPKRALERQWQDFPRTPITEYSSALIAEGLADVIEAGGYGAIGEHGEQPGLGSHWEIWSYAQAMTPIEALTVASKHAAYFIGLDKEIGTVAVGKLADLVIPKCQSARRHP